MTKQFHVPWRRVLVVGWLLTVSVGIGSGSAVLDPPSARWALAQVADQDQATSAASSSGDDNATERMDDRAKAEPAPSSKPADDEAQGDEEAASQDATPQHGDASLDQAAVKDAQPANRAPKRIVLIEFHADINSFTKEYLFRKLDKARELKPDVLIIEIESPGGEIENTMAIGARLRDIEWAHTVAYVPKQALSGAALFSLGCDELIVAPNAVYGDAGPITMAEDFLFRHAPEKIRSDLVRRARDLAVAKGRPPALAEAMIDMNVEVFETVHAETGERRWLTEDEIRATGEADKWQSKKLVLESRKDLFLEVNGRRAVELELATISLSRRQDVRQYFAPVEEWTEMGWSGLDTTVLILNSPIVTALLFIVGLVGLYIELASPGLGIGGVLAAVCFCVFFWSRFLGGTGEWLDVVLFLTGIMLTLVEIFVIPGFGVWGISGGLCIIASLVMASQSHLIPQTKADLNQTVMWATVTMGSMLTFVVIAGMLTRRMGSIPILRGFLLEPPVDTARNTDPLNETEQDGRIIRVGDTGVAESPLRPAGRILLDGEYVDAISDGSYVDAGDAIQVVDVRANRVVVRRISG